MVDLIVTYKLLAFPWSFIKQTYPISPLAKTFCY